MHFIVNNNSNSNNNFFEETKLGFFFFILGIFFLPSTLLIGSFFLLIAGLIGSFKQKSYFNDKWNLMLFSSGILMLLSCILQKFFLSNIYSDILNSNLSFIGLGNWLPLFWLFWTLQTYLDSTRKRRIFAISLISGSLPVILTGFAQYFFNINGPFKTLNGLIIWYQRPIEEPAGLSGLFSNQNYAGSWLCIVWPFCLALILDNWDVFHKRIIEYFFLISVGLAAFLTNSRNAWLGIITSIPIMILKRKIHLYVFSILISSIVSLYLIFPNLDSETQKTIINLIPNTIMNEFSQDGYIGLDVSRLEIFANAINYIIQSPLFGYGSTSFTKIFQYKTGFWKGHSHNLLFELALSYGIPVAILLFSTISSTLIFSFKKIFIKNNFTIYEKAFWASSFTYLLSQLVDIQYFDGKISIIFWILLAGLKNIITAKKENKNISLLKINVK